MLRLSLAGEATSIFQVGGACITTDYVFGCLWEAIFGGSGLYTGANTDVGSPELAAVLKQNKYAGALVGISSRCAGVTRTNQLECWKCR